MFVARYSMCLGLVPVASGSSIRFGYYTLSVCSGDAQALAATLRSASVTQVAITCACVCLALCADTLFA